MTIAIAIVTIGILIILHELGHFLLAKKFGVKVEEFGIGLPPRLFGKKFGETLYSVNALPLGGFVRMEGEEVREDGPRSFNTHAIWQRFLIVAGGVFVFWVIAAVIFMFLAATSGIPMAIGEDETAGVNNPHVRIIGVAADSPASNAGLQLGDTIVEMRNAETGAIRSDITARGHVQEFTQENKGEKIVLVIQRGNDVLDFPLTPREDPPQNEGAMGVALTRAGFVAYEWYEAPLQGVLQTGQLTITIFETFGFLISSVFDGSGLPEGAQLSGPVGVIGLLSDTFALGIPSFFAFVAIISVYLAIFNSLPIPALDGGRAFFILLEGVRKKPLPEKLERRLIMVSFILLIPLIIWATIGDIQRIF
jgi:regulator of sigma E protease